MSCYAGLGCYLTIWTVANRRSRFPSGYFLVQLPWVGLTVERRTQISRFGCTYSIYGQRDTIYNCAEVVSKSGCGASKAIYVFTKFKDVHACVSGQRPNAPVQTLRVPCTLLCAPSQSQSRSQSRANIKTTPKQKRLERPPDADKVREKRWSLSAGRTARAQGTKWVSSVVTKGKW
jgi:hypothetical protein